MRAAPSTGPLGATRSNPIVRAFSERRLAAGEPTEVALTACLHELPTILDAILRQREPWQAAPAPARPA